VAAETFHPGVVFQDPVITAEAPSRLGGSGAVLHRREHAPRALPPGGQTLFVCPAVAAILPSWREAASAEPGRLTAIPAGHECTGTALSPYRLFSHLALSGSGEQGQGPAWGTHVQ